MKDKQHNDQKQRTDDAMLEALKVTERMNRDASPRAGFAERTLLEFQKRCSDAPQWKARQKFFPAQIHRVPRFAFAALLLLVMLNITTLFVVSRHTQGRQPSHVRQSSDSYHMAMDDGSFYGSLNGERENHEH